MEYVLTGMFIAVILGIALIAYAVPAAMIAAVVHAALGINPIKLRYDKNGHLKFNSLHWINYILSPAHLVSVPFMRRIAIKNRAYADSVIGRNNEQAVFAKKSWQKIYDAYYEEARIQHIARQVNDDLSSPFPGAKLGATNIKYLSEKDKDLYHQIYKERAYQSI